MRSLSSILWRERRLAARSDRFALQAAELDRAIVVQSLVEHLDLRDDVSLRELAAELPSPWSDVFDDHHAALSAQGEQALPRSLVDFLR